VFVGGYKNVGVWAIGKVVQNAQETLTFNGEEFNTTAGTFPVTVDASTPSTDSEDWFNVTLEARKTVARSLNKLDGDVTYAAAGTVVAEIIFDASQQKTYAVPVDAQGKIISSVVGNVLNTTVGGPYKLNSVETTDTVQTQKTNIPTLSLPPNVAEISTPSDGRLYSISTSVNGLENTPDTIKMADGRFANRVGGFKPQRLGVFKTSPLLGHRVGDFLYEKHSQTHATLLTDLSRYIPFTEDDVGYPGVTVGYVDWAKGNDNTGDGLSWATAKAYLNEGRKLHTDILFIRAGVYNRLQRFLDFPMAQNRTMIAVGGKVITGPIASGTWTKTGGQTNVYQLDYASGLTNVTNAVYDTAILNSELGATKYTELGSIVAVDAQAGSFFHTGTTTYVHAIDSRDLVVFGDELRLTQPAAGLNITFDGNFKLYWKDIEHWGGTGGGSNGLEIKSNGNVWENSSFYNRDCAFSGSQDGGSGRALAVGDVGVVISERASVTNSRKDGINYHHGINYGTSSLSPHYVEIDCQTHGNGEGGSEGNNQGSTAHEDCVGIRIDGDYSGHLDGQNIADVDGAKCYIICCTSKGSALTGMALSANGWPFEVNDAIWWIDGGHCSDNGVIGNGTGDIAIDGFFTQLHMQDTNTEKPISTRTFSNVPDEDFS
jgi:hypothetical protein